MPLSPSPTFGGRSFGSKAGARSYFSLMLNSYALLERVSENDAAALHDLLLGHPKLEEKLCGRSVSHFQVHPFVKGSRCFFLVRDDGTWEHFGIDRCLDNIYRKQ